MARDSDARIKKFPGKSVGETRRALLLEAAMEAVAERGLSRLRVKDVAAAAGVATGTVHYHFEDLDEVYVGVHELAVERFVQARREAVRGLSDARAKLRALANTGVPDDDTDLLVGALYELSPLVRRDSAHRALMRSLSEQQVALYLTVLEVGEAQGHFSFVVPPEDIATNAVALEDAYGLHIWERTGLVTGERARRLMLGHLAAATNCLDLLQPDSTEEDDDART